MNPSVEAATRSFEVEALLANADGRLKPGFFARASIASSHVDDALSFPRRRCATSTGPTRSTPSRRARLRETEVKLGTREGDQAEIVDGLKEGARVAVPIEGEELRDGATVTAVRTPEDSSHEPGRALRQARCLRGHAHRVPRGAGDLLLPRPGRRPVPAGRPGHRQHQRPASGGHPGGGDDPGGAAPRGGALHASAAWTR